MHDSTPDQRSLSSSTDELDEDSPKSSLDPTQDSEKQKNQYPKAWPSCPDLSIQENIWQMRQPAIERRKRPSSLYQMKYSANSPRNSVYSPRSSGYWSELEQLSESETFSSAPTKSAESTGQEKSKTSSEETEASTTETPNNTKTEVEEPENKFLGAWQMTRGVFQQWGLKVNRTRSSECLSRDADSFRGKAFHRINSMPLERHTKKISEKNTQRKAFMTDV